MGCFNIREIPDSILLGLMATDAILVISAIVLAILGFTKVLSFPPAANYSLLGGSAALLAIYGLIMAMNKSK